MPVEDTTTTEASAPSGSGAVRRTAARATGERKVRTRVPGPGASGPGGAGDRSGGGSRGGAGTGDGGTDGAGTGALSVLSAIEAPLATFVESFEPERFTGVDAESLVVAFDRIERLASAGKTVAASRAARANAHKRKGHTNPTQWLADLTGESAGQAASTLATGEALSSQPEVEEALRQGKLGKERARLVTDAASADPDSTEELLGSAEEESMGELKRRCLSTKARAHEGQSEKERDARLQAARRCRTSTDPVDGAFLLDARLTPLAGARVLTALEQETVRQSARAQRTGEGEPFSRHMADALVALITGKGRAPAVNTPKATDSDGENTSDDSASAHDSASGEDSPSADERPDTAPGPDPDGAAPAPDDEDEVDGDGSPVRDTVHVRIDLEALRRGRVAGGEVCEIPGVGPISITTALDVLGDALLRLIITNGVDVTTVTTMSRNIPAALRAALIERDPVCVIPGCGQRPGLETDHWQVDYGKKGPTAWWNIARLCKAHHRMRTHDGFVLSGGPGKWRWDPPGHPPDGHRGSTDLPGDDQPGDDQPPLFTDSG